MIAESIAIEVVGQGRTFAEEVREREEVRAMLGESTRRVLGQVADLCDFRVERLTIKVTGEKRSLALGFAGVQVEIVLDDDRPLLSLFQTHSSFEEWEEPMTAFAVGRL